MRYSQLFAALAVICVLLPAAGALGQAGTRPDPDSPAGVEYQLPLQQARQNASEGGGDKAGGGGAGRTVPLFGAGIPSRDKGDKGGASDPGGEDAGSGTGARASASNGEDSGGGNAGARDTAISRSAVGGAEPDDGSAALRIGAIALAVLLAGGLLGLGLRRGLQQTGD